MFFCGKNFATWQVLKVLGKCHKIKWSNLHLVTIYWMMIIFFEPSMWWSIDIRCHPRGKHNAICCHNPLCIIMSFTFATITSLPPSLVVRACKSSHCLYVYLKHFSLTFCLHIQDNVCCQPRNNTNLWRFICKISFKH